MDQIKFDLKHGLKVGEDVLKEVTLREVNAGDIIKATEESEKLVFAQVAKDKTEPMLVTSPALMGINILRRQIASIGNLSGPVELSLFEKLSGDDLDLLQTKAEELETAALAETASQAVAQKGRRDKDQKDA